MLFICRIKRESEEKSVSTGKLLQMLTTRSAKNKERAVQLECCLYSLNIHLQETIKPNEWCDGHFCTILYILLWGFMIATRIWQQRVQVCYGTYYLLITIC